MDWPEFISATLCVIAGGVLGVLLPLRACGRIQGFKTGMIAGSFLNICLALIAGAFFTGLADQWAIGSATMPLAFVTGSSLTLCLLSFLAGTLGVLASHLLNEPGTTLPRRDFGTTTRPLA